MFRTIQWAIAGTGGLVVAAAVAALRDGKLTNFLIGAAMVATNALVFYLMMERKLGDAYETGKGAQMRLAAAKGSPQN